MARQAPAPSPTPQRLGEAATERHHARGVGHASHTITAMSTAPIDAASQGKGADFGIGG